MVRDYVRFLKAPDEFHAFLDEYQGESDRAAAVLGAAYLDERLKSLLSASFAEGADSEKLLGIMRPLGAFGSRIAVAHAIGLVTLPEKRDLDRVREIRNEFAHHLHGLEFTAQKIADRIRAFECVEERFGAIPGLREIYPREPRRLFDLAVALLGYYVDRRIAHARNFHAAQPPLWPFPGE